MKQENSVNFLSSTIQHNCNNLLIHILRLENYQKEVEKNLQLYVEENREFIPGELVEVYDRDTDQKLGEGIVGNAATRVRLDKSNLEYYEKNSGKFNDALLDIRYEIFAVKKNGTPSSKHFFHIPHYVPSRKTSSSYIKKK